MMDLVKNGDAANHGPNTESELFWKVQLPFVGHHLCCLEMGTVSIERKLLWTSGPVAEIHG